MPQSGELSMTCWSEGLGGGMSRQGSQGDLGIPSPLASRCGRWSSAKEPEDRAQSLAWDSRATQTRLQSHAGASGLAWGRCSLREAALVKEPLPQIA